MDRIDGTEGDWVNVHDEMEKIWPGFVEWFTTKVNAEIAAGKVDQDDKVLQGMRLCQGMATIWSGLVPIPQQISRDDIIKSMAKATMVGFLFANWVRGPSDDLERERHRT